MKIRGKHITRTVHSRISSMRDSKKTSRFFFGHKKNTKAEWHFTRDQLRYMANVAKLNINELVLANEYMYRSVRGFSVSNPSMREAVDMNEEQFKRAKRKLVTSGVLVLDKDSFGVMEVSFFLFGLEEEDEAEPVMEEIPQEEFSDV